MGTHFRSVMLKIVLIAIVSALIWDKSNGYSSGYTYNNPLDPSLKPAQQCNWYHEEQTYIDNLYKAKYVFKLTPREGSFDNTREQCINMGGDLIPLIWDQKEKNITSKLNNNSFV